MPVRPTTTLGEVIQQAGQALDRAGRVEPALDPEDREEVAFIRDEILPSGSALKDETPTSADDWLGILLASHELPTVIEAKLWRDHDAGNHENDPTEGAYALVQAAADLLRQAIRQQGLNPDGGFSRQGRQIGDPALADEAAAGPPPHEYRLNGTRRLLDPALAAR